MGHYFVLGEVLGERTPWRIDSLLKSLWRSLLEPAHSCRAGAAWRLRPRTAAILSAPRPAAWPAAPAHTRRPDSCLAARTARSPPGPPASFRDPWSTEPIHLAAM